MKKLLFVACVSSLLLGACTSHPVTQVPNKVDPASQKIINELKNGIAIYFDRNSSQVEAKYHIYLLTAAKGLAQNKNFILELEGHTDNTGSAATNKKVSLERANAVRSKLVMDFNVNPNQVKAFGAGSAQPIDTNNTVEGRANNRRVSAILKIQ